MRTIVNIQDSNKIAKEKNNDRRIKWYLKTDLSLEMKKINDKSNDKLQ